MQTPLSTCNAHSHLTAKQRHPTPTHKAQYPALTHDTFLLRTGITWTLFSAAVRQVIQGWWVAAGSSLRVTALETLDLETFRRNWSGVGVKCLSLPICGVLPGGPVWKREQVGRGTREVGEV